VSARLKSSPWPRLFTDLPKDAVTAPLSVHHTHLDDVVVVRLRGDVDMSNVGTLHDALRRASGSSAGRRVLVDATAVEFLSVAGMTALVEAHMQCERSGLDFAVVTGQPAVLRSLHLVGLDRQLTVVPAPAATSGAAQPAGVGPGQSSW
jgi:anti-sigma B factor antagonist